MDFAIRQVSTFVSLVLIINQKWKNEELEIVLEYPYNSMV